MRKPKSLREAYASDPAARKFLQDHPEFAGFEIESTHDKPSNEDYYNAEREAHTKSEQALLIQEALNFYADDNVTLRLLLAYYDGATTKQLQIITGASRDTTWVVLHRAKRRVYEWALRRPWERQNLGEAAPVDERTLVFRGQRRKVHLVQIGTGDTVWCAEDGAILPADVQEILDESQHDPIYLDEESET